VVSTPLKNISQLGLFPIYGKIIQMFQTINQIGKNREFHQQEPRQKYGHGIIAT
jgi:hypothetical protein